MSQQLARKLTRAYVVRLLGFALLSFLLISFAFYAALAWGYARRALNPGCIGDLASLEEVGIASEAVDIRSRDGILLRGWYARGSRYPEIVIIVQPGHGGNTRAALPDAAILAGEGYGTLLFEHRSCADPSLPASTGFVEAQDILGAVDYLRSRSDVVHIGAMGESAGGTASVFAAAQDAGIEAVISMGGYANLEDDIVDAGAAHRLDDAIFRRLVVWSVGLQLGTHPAQISPRDVVGQISPRPVLLIYGEYESAVGQEMYAAAREPRELWIVPGSGHAGYRWVAPEEYHRHVVAFFDSAFGVTSSPGP